VPLAAVQDFKRIGDGDVGPNTGGMGAYSPVPWLDDVAGLVDSIHAPVVAELARRGTPFVGCLFAGLMITDDGPRVLEFNARFGDPETQVVLPLLATPLGELLYAAAIGTLAAHPRLRWHPGAAVTVVVAGLNYPDTPRTGDVIEGGERPGVIHAGTARRSGDGALISAGGRVLSATGTGPDLAAAREAAYALVDGIRLDGSHHRSDIALAAVQGRITV
jgi:phosphoribosylamine---glycine ligase